MKLKKKKLVIKIYSMEFNGSKTFYIFKIHKK